MRIRSVNACSIDCSQNGHVLRLGWIENTPQCAPTNQRVKSNDKVTKGTNIHFTY